jgi:hypothetical protein
MTPEDRYPTVEAWLIKADQALADASTPAGLSGR